MVKIRSIKVHLQSESNQTVPEYPCGSTFQTISTTQRTRGSSTSVYIPTYNSLKYRIIYSVLPPHPPDSHYYFRLFINGGHVVDWGSGPDEGYKGSAVFTLREPLNSYESPISSDDGNTKSSDTTTGLNDRSIEIKVYRSKGRKKVNLVLEGPDKDETTSTYKAYEMATDSEDNIAEQRLHKYHKYALIDPITQPFASLSFNYRTWDELSSLGLATEQEISEHDENTIETSVGKPYTNATANSSQISIPKKGRFTENISPNDEGISTLPPPTIAPVTGNKRQREHSPLPAILVRPEDSRQSHRSSTRDDDKYTNVSKDRNSEESVQRARKHKRKGSTLDSVVLTQTAPGELTPVVAPTVSTSRPGMGPKTRSLPYQKPANILTGLKTHTPLGKAGNRKSDPGSAGNREVRKLSAFR